MRQGPNGATSRELKESLKAVADKIHVHRAESAANGPNAILARGCEKLGWRTAVCPRNARDCVDCSFCCFGCPHGRAAGAHTLLAPHSCNLEHRCGGVEAFEAYLRKVRSQGLKSNAFALFSAHQTSSFRIGGDPKTGAIQRETWEVENLFVVDGSVLPTAVGVNPMLPIMGTAHYLAQHVQNRLT